MTVEIVEADLTQPEQARALVEILDSYARDPMGGEQPLSAEVRARLPERLAQESQALVLLALRGGRPVGVAVCFRGFSTFAARPLLNIHDLAVLPAVRGMGVGSALLSAAEARARALGCCKLTLEVRADNVRARALYERVGFGDFAPGSEATPTHFLEKRLS
jgi:ribosomal protein S18 acetylase RimI-like enzyme